MVNAKEEFDTAKEEFEKSLSSVYEWFQDWDALQQSVFDCCMAEFGVRVLLVRPS